MADERYYGKYRGTVTNNVDPEKMGRIQATVPDAPGAATSWALPCVPVAGNQMGMYAVPPVGASVWIEFEQGKPDNPIWSGCFWGSAAEVPPPAGSIDPSSPAIILQTGGQNGIVISDMPGEQGGIIIKSPTGASITVNETGITIQSGGGASIVLTGTTVSANNGALEVR